MSDPAAPAAHAAELLATSAPGLARLAAEEVVGRLASAERYGASARDVWRDHLAGRLSDLSLALADDRPDHFLDEVGWAKVAFASRGVPLEDLATSLRCLRDVLARELPESAGEPTTALVDRALDRWSDLGRAEESGMAAGTATGRLAARHLVALLEGNRAEAGELVLDAVRSGGLSPQEAILDVCLPVERELGRMWHLDEITVAEEHFVSATTERLLSQVSALAPPVAPLGRTVVAAALEGDDHDIGLRAVTELFELDGWRTVFLGRGLPPADLLWAVSAFEADLLLLSATLGRHVAPVGAAVAAVRDGRAEGRVPKILVGGPAFNADPELWRRVGADAGVFSARDAVAEGRRLTD